MTKVLDKCGDFLLRWRISKKTLAIVFVVLFVLSLVPIVITCFYSVPGADDFGFGTRAHLSVVNGGSFLEGVLDTCNFYYNNWQGFYTANFFFAIQPFTVDVNLYWITNLLYLLTICLSWLYFSKVVLIDVFKASKSNYVLISLPIITVFLQFMPGVQQAIYNTVAGFSLVVNFIYLVVFAFIIQYHLNLQNKSKKRWKYLVGVLLLSVVFSGVAPIVFVTVLMVFIPSLVYCIYRKYSVYKLLIAVMIIVTVGLLISILAPGNAVRQASEDGLSIPMAIIKSFTMSFYYLGEWSTLFYVAIIAFLSVIFYGVVKESKYQFKYPLLVFLICYLIFAGRISVQYYATGSVGGWRQLNEHYLCFLISITISILYFVGWISKKARIIDVSVANKKQVSIVFIAIVAFMFVSGAAYYAYGHTITSVSTAVSYIKGETQTYHKEMCDRMNLLEISDSDDIGVLPISVYPAFFGDDSITDNSDFWSNEEVAHYYGKESVWLKK